MIQCTHVPDPVSAELLETKGNRHGGSRISNAKLLEQQQTGMKTCGECKENKSVDDFHKNKRMKDGLNRVCKKCAIAMTSKHYHRNKDTN